VPIQNIIKENGQFKKCKIDDISKTTLALFAIFCELVQFTICYNLVAIVSFKFK